jgi:Recombinase
MRMRLRRDHQTQIFGIGSRRKSRPTSCQCAAPYLLGRNPHRTGAAWTLRTVAAILANPRYTGRRVWNRQRTDFDLVDPVNTSLGHRQVRAVEPARRLGHLQTSRARGAGQRG